MKSILLALMLLVSPLTFTQSVKPIQITITGVREQTKCEFKDSVYFLTNSSIYVDPKPGTHELYIYSEWGVLVYELYITPKTSLIVISIK